MSFPLNSNQAYIKDTGERTTLGEIIGEGGGSDLPEYSEEDAGKVLSVNEEGELAWATPASGSVNFSRGRNTFPGLNATISGKGVS